MPLVLEFEATAKYSTRNEFIVRFICESKSNLFASSPLYNLSDEHLSNWTFQSGNEVISTCWSNLNDNGSVGKRVS